MEKRSSMKDSGLHALFRATETTKQPASGVAPAAQIDPETASSASTESPQESGADSRSGEGHAREERPEDRAADSGRRSLIQPSRTFPAVIRVVGVGGAGTNAINRMLEAGLEGVEFIAINTDVQALSMCEADHKLRIGRELTKGLGGGSDPQIGRQAAVTAYDEIKAHPEGQRHGLHHGG